MVDWDRYRGGFGGGWAVSWFVNAMQGHCNVNPIFCLLGDFVASWLQYLLSFSGHAPRKKTLHKESRIKKEADSKVDDSCRLPKR